MQCIHNVDSHDWDGFDQYVEDIWRSEQPVYVTQDMKEIIENDASFSATPIGPIHEHVASEFLLHLILPSFANSYIVNSCDDAAHVRKLLTDHKLPHPNIVVYPYQSQRYNYDILGNWNPSVLEALNKEKPIIANLLVDHFGHSFISGKKCMELKLPCSIHVFKLCMYHTRSFSYQHCEESAN